MGGAVVRQVVVAGPVARNPKPQVGGVTRLYNTWRFIGVLLS